MSLNKCECGSEVSLARNFCTFCGRKVLVFKDREKPWMEWEILPYSGFKYSPIIVPLCSVI